MVNTKIEANTAFGNLFFAVIPDPIRDPGHLKHFLKRSINLLGVIVDPFQEGVKKAFHIPELSAADFVELLIGDFLIEMDHPVPVSRHFFQHPPIVYA